MSRSRQSPPERQPDLRLRRAVGAADVAEGAGPARAALGGEAREGAGLEVDPPVAEQHDLVGVVGLGRVALDDEDAHQAAAELLGRVAVGVEEEGAGVGRREAVAEASARARPAAASDRARRPGRSAGGCRASGSRCARPRAAGGSRRPPRAGRRASSARPGATSSSESVHIGRMWPPKQGSVPGRSAATRRSGTVRPATGGRRRERHGGEAAAGTGEAGPEGDASCPRHEPAARDCSHGRPVLSFIAAGRTLEPRAILARARRLPRCDRLHRSVSNPSGGDAYSLPACEESERERVSCRR